MTNLTSFIYSADLGCKVYDPPLNGYYLKHKYFIVREECKDSLIYLHTKEIERNGRDFFGWMNLVSIADAIGLPIQTTCQFMEKWEKVRDGLFEQKGLTSRQIRKQVEDSKKRLKSFNCDPVGELKVVE